MEAIDTKQTDKQKLRGKHKKIGLSKVVQTKEEVMIIGVFSSYFCRVRVYTFLLSYMGHKPVLTGLLDE